MPRFWTRVLHPFRHNHKKRHSITRQEHLVDNYTSNNKTMITTTKTPLFSYSLSSCLTESEIYRDDLVRMDILEHALEDNIETFFCTWNEELERIFEKCRWALDSLTYTIQELSHEICNITSPLQNPNQQSLCNVHQFISNYLKEWEIQHRHNDNSINSMKKPSFDIYFESLQSKSLATKDPGLSHFIQQIYQWEHDFFLFKQYFESQMAILWNILFDQGTIQRLLQTCWGRRYHQCMSKTQALEDKMKILLEQSIPSKEEFTCAICLSVLSEPVTIASCLHTFCRPCIQRLYCTCTLSSCSSPCHKASRRQRPEQYYFNNNTNTNNNNSFSLSKDKRTPPQQQQQKRLFPRHSYLPQKRHSSILYCKKKQKLLSCQCYHNELTDTLPFLPPKHPTCPLCRSPFTLKDCTINVALDNLISLYFSYEEKVDDDHNNLGTNNMITTTSSLAPTRRKMGFGVNSSSNEQQYHKRRSVIYNAIHQPFLWISSSSSSRRQQQQQEQMTTMGGLTNLVPSSSSSTQQNDDNTIVNESPLPRQHHTRYQQQTATITSTTQPEPSEEYGHHAIFNRDLYNLARRTWWF